MTDPLLVAARENHVEWLREQCRWSGRAGTIEEGEGLLLYASATRFPVSFNGVVRLDPAVPARAVIDRADVWFGERRRGYSLLTVDLDGRDDDLCDAAPADGLVPAGSSPEMVLRAPIGPPVPGDGVALEWVCDAEGLADFAAVCSAAYRTIGLPEGIVQEAFTDVARFTSPWVHSVVARVDGVPVAGAQVLLSHGIAGIYWVGTTAGARGRGLGETVTRAVAERAFDLGAAVVTLQASPQGEPIYRRLGFEGVYGTATWMRAGTGGR
jgi:ribosomal protein S18 acetylase RimI-like enzyme